MVRLRITGRIVATCMLLLTAASLLSACNTIAGAGQDTSAAGRAITNSADKAK
jgi:entericidin B